MYNNASPNQLLPARRKRISGERNQGRAAILTALRRYGSMEGGEK
jgi:hypothetical protein